MALNISDSFCEAVDQIVTARMQEVKFDKTVVCTIVDDENAGATNYYTVSEGSFKFSAYSVELYKKNEQVLVLIPQGDYNNQKTIIGKYVPKDDTGYTFLDLKDQFLPLVTLEDSGSLDTKSGNKTFNWELNTVNTATCTHIYMSANFNAVMQRQSGNYGIKLVVRQANQITVQYLWDSSELFGNPFQFTNATLQETIITLNTPVVDIENIQFSLYHPALNEQNGEYIAINDITCQIGYLLQETYLDELIIDVNNEKEKFYPSRSLIAETNKKLLELKSIIQYDGNRQYVTNDNDFNKVVGLSQEIQQAFADLHTSPLYKGNQNTEITVIDTTKNIEKELLNNDATINENKYLIRTLNLTWKHINPTTGQINIYKNKSFPPEPLLDNELPEGTTIEVVRWYIESGNPYEEIEKDKIAGYEIPDIKPFGTTFKQFINSGQNSIFYPLTARVKLLPESITARAGAVLIPLVLTKIPGSENLQWIQNGASVKSELLTFQQDGAVIAAADLQENTNIPKNVVNIAIGNEELQKDESDSNITIHEVQGSYYYGSNITSSPFQASNIYSIICYFQSDYKSGDKVRYIKQSGGNITAQLTMPNGKPAPTNAFTKGALCMLLIKEDGENPPIIQLPFIM